MLPESDPGRFRRLACLVVRSDLWAMFGLGTREVPHVCGKACEEPPALQFPGGEWATCPMYELGRDEHFREGQRLYRLSKIAPLASFPGGYAAWVPEVFLAIQGALDDYAAELRDDADEKAGRSA